MQIFKKQKRDCIQKTSGAFVEIDETTGWITKIAICAMDDQGAEIVRGALARIFRPNCFTWLRRIISKIS